MMFLVKVFFIFLVFVPAYSEDLPKNQAPLIEDQELLSPSSEKEEPREYFFSNYNLSLGTSILSRSFSGEDTNAKLLKGTLNALIGKKNWNYSNLYLNIRQRKEKKNENLIIFEALPRLFYTFPVVGMYFYAGVGLGFGFQPQHIWAKNKEVGRLFSLNGQALTGLKAPNIYKNFGLFMELNMNFMMLPFADPRDDDGYNYDTADAFLSLNIGASYQF